MAITGELSCLYFDNRHCCRELSSIYSNSSWIELYLVWCLQQIFLSTALVDPNNPGKEALVTSNRLHSWQSPPPPPPPLLVTVACNKQDLTSLHCSLEIFSWETKLLQRRLNNTTPAYTCNLNKKGHCCRQATSWKLILKTTFPCVPLNDHWFHTLSALNWL